MRQQKLAVNELYTAAVSGDEKFLDANSEHDLLSCQTPLGNNIIHLAAEGGKTSFIKKAVGLRPFLITQQNQKGDTPLHVAARFGHTDAVELLLQDGTTTAPPDSVSINIEKDEGDLILDRRPWRMRNLEGSMALHDAMRNGHEKVALLLLQRDPHLASVVTDAGESPLYLAAEQRWYRNVVEKILTSGAPYSTQGPWRQNLLHAMALNIYVWDGKCVETVVDEHPDLVKQKDEFGRTALHYAAISRWSSSFASWLLRKDVSAAYEHDANGLTPLLLAASVGGRAIIEEILKYCPDSMELLDRKDRHILHAVIESNSYRTFQVLLKNPQMQKLINKPDKEGNTPLHLAIQKKDYPVLKELLTNKNVDIMPEIKVTIRDHLRSDPEFQIFYEKNDLVDELWRPNERSQLRVGKDSKDPLSQKILSMKEMELFKSRYFSSDPRPFGELLKETSDNLSVVATLLTTLTFAAAFTIPGGYNNNPPREGMAVLGKKAAFHAFILSDTVAVCSSVIVVFLLIWQQRDFVTLKRRITYSIRLLIVAIGGTLVAFMSGLYAVISGEVLWLAVLVCVASSVFLLIFVILILAAAFGSFKKMFNFVFLIAEDIFLEW
ncbi:protein ACCELERATED CELL DEATH 6-like [Malania oleifera]|uniref:protein ACCELERATED CELL DEATH 6-like n=1 Tax=Malania oleifera TaxID=397392 RepID=UPI0025AE24F4|nr:protein ACCELERATED CELL DEATH 6-like [Malania oleifera]